MFCSKCGAEVEGGTKVCPNCEANLELGMKDFTDFAGRKAKGLFDRAKSRLKSKPDSSGVEERLSELSKLKELLDSGALSSEEYGQLKQQIIQRV